MPGSAYSESSVVFAFLILYSVASFNGKPHLRNGVACSLTVVSFNGKPDLKNEFAYSLSGSETNCFIS